MGFGGVSHVGGRGAVRGWFRTGALLGCRLVVGGLFVVAGAMKVVDMRTFVDVVQAYRIAPHVLIVPIAFAVPWMEVVLGAGVLLGLWLRSSAVLSAGLLLAFAAGLIVNIARGADISCGCFGPYFADTSLEGALLRNAVLIGMSGVLFMVRNVPFSLDGAMARRRDAPGP